MFEGPHVTNFGRVPPFQWWIPPVSCNHDYRVWRSQGILLGWQGLHSVNLIWFNNMIWEYCKHCFEVFWYFFHFLISILLVVLKHDDELFLRLVLHLDGSFWHLEVWRMQISITEIEQWLCFVSIWRRWALINKQPGEISVFSTWFCLRKFGRFGIGSRNNSRTKYSGCSCNQII